MIHLQAALQRHDGAQIKRRDRAFIRDAGEMRRTENPVVAYAATACRMAAEVAEIGSAITAQQFEIDHDARLRARDLNFEIFGFFLWQSASFSPPSEPCNPLKLGD
jgi:hypothetical protein